MYREVLELLSQALDVWPTVHVKFYYLEMLLSNSQPSGQNKDPSTVLLWGIDVMNKVLEKQPHLFIRNNFQLITQVCAQTN
jgi:transformation/transcription domain-associated protein